MNQYKTNRNALIKYLDSQGWNYDIRKDDGETFLVELGFKSSSKLKHYDLYVRANERGIRAHAVSPIKADREDYPNVVEYITRANYGLTMGCFEFDYSDGEVGFRTYLTSIDGDPEIDNVEWVVDMPGVMFRRYGDGLAKALMGFGDPEADIAAAEA